MVRISIWWHYIKFQEENIRLEQINASGGAHEVNISAEDLLQKESLRFENRVKHMLTQGVLEQSSFGAGSRRSLPACTDRVLETNIENLLCMRLLEWSARKCGRTLECRNSRHFPFSDTKAQKPRRFIHLHENRLPPAQECWTDICSVQHGRLRDLSLKCWTNIYSVQQFRLRDLSLSIGKNPPQVTTAAANLVSEEIPSTVAACSYLLHTNIVFPTAEDILDSDNLTDAQTPDQILSTEDDINNMIEEISSKEPSFTTLADHPYSTAPSPKSPEPPAKSTKNL
ncbi:ATP-dependent DNA helicase Q-like 4A [Platanthera guangdongensis]|uniref:ATP-dependent DNA helicase Q-like 4A n=1 Tax=Platanthera guangdongensis TaxID=2320717 RepID=A0ABR2M5J9_9ASPA